MDEVPLIVPNGAETTAMSPVLWFRTDQFRRRWALLSKFVIGQSASQFLGLLSGFFLVRWLSVEDYAQCSFTASFQGMVAMLLDMGFAGSIVALVGTRTSEPAVLGGYIKAAKHFRRRIAWGLLPAAAVMFWLASRKHSWPLLTQGLLFSSLVASVLFQGTQSMYSAPLQIRRRIGTLYRWSAFVAGIRLTFFAVLHALSMLSGWLTCWANAGGTWLTARSYKAAGANYVAEPKHVSEKASREMIRYLAPLMPGIIFTAFQGQIIVFVITAFGKSRGIAEVAALGRLGQVFVLLGGFNGAILLPYIAARPRAVLFRNYFLVLVLSACFVALICSIGWLAPGPLLWILGPKYSHLTRELRLLLVVSSLNYVGAIMWTMHSARRWVYWWGSGLYIGALIIVQGYLMLTQDLSTTSAVLKFSIWSAVTVIAVHLCTAVYGFSRFGAASEAQYAQ